MFILANRQPHEQGWRAMMALGTLALVMLWPTFKSWLLGQLRATVGRERRVAAAVTRRRAREGMAWTYTGLGRTHGSGHGVCH